MRRKQENIKPLTAAYMNRIGVAPKMRRLVNLLRKHGFATQDSGDGTGETPVPHVHCEVYGHELVAEAHRLHALLLSHGVTFPPQTEDGDQPDISSDYTPIRASGVLSVWNVTDAMLAKPKRGT